MTGTLLLCATPIGNLDDASPRLAAALGAADVVYCEDTRRSATLLRHFGVTAPLRSYFAGNEASRAAELADELAAGKTVALVTDAGMPALSDPGVSAVRAAVAAGAAVTVIPGPSAVTAALAVSGLPAERFVFEGFLPRRGGERTGLLGALAAEQRTIVLFVAPHRVASDLGDLASALGPDRRVVVCRELTKMFEEVWRGDLAGAAEHFAAGRGEFTVVIAGAEPAEALPLDDVLELIAAGMALSEAVRTVSGRTGVSRSRLYDAALRARDGA